MTTTPGPDWAAVKVPLDYSRDNPRGFAPEPSSRLYRDMLLPRSVVPLAWFYSLLLLPAFLLGASYRRRNASRPPHVVIESGKIGWTQLFFEELATSAGEYFGAECVYRVAVDREASYEPQFRDWLSREDPTHVILDVRTPPQSWPASLVLSLRASWSLLRQGIYPIVIMTDAFNRRQRWHASILSAWQGMVMTFADETLVRRVFPHRRVRGPMIMPLSLQTLDRLVVTKTEDGYRRGAECVIAFVGFNYPPRSFFLAALSDELTSRGMNLLVHGDKRGRSNEEYWQLLSDADVIVTTTMQGPDRTFIDWNWIRQAVHRFSETFAAQTALVAAPVDGGFAPFVEGRDYLEFGSVNEAADAIEYLANHPDARRRMADKGHETLRNEIASGSFWRVALSQESGLP